MTKMNTRNQLKNCSSCGAPIVSEICAYCGVATGLNTAEATMEYPVLECKEVVINFFTVGLPLIFGIAFGMGGFIPLIIALIGHSEIGVLLMGIPFFLISIVALFFLLCTISRYIKVKTCGRTIQAVVYGYMDDNVLINHQAAQIVKLLVQTPSGPRFILYQLGNTLRPYKINDNIDIMVYQNYFMICKKSDFVQW